jgi:ABC-type uncharacterized transport system involved in gliding motility auxiliary subunit
VRRALAVARTNLAVTWLTPIPYVAGVVLHIALGILFVDQVRAREQAVLQPLFPLAGFLLVALVPLLTMRSIAEERRSGTLDLLRAVPVPPGALIAGKFAAAVVTALGVLAPAVLHVVLLDLYGDPDTGPAVAGFVGLALLVVALCGVGLLASSVTTSQPVAAAVAFFTTLVLWFAHLGSGSVTTGAVLAHLSLSERLRAFAGGGLAVPDGGHLLAVALVCLAAAAAVLGARRGAAVAAAVAVLLAVVSDRAGTIVDLTAERTLSLTAETEAVIDEIDRDVEVTVFLRTDEPGRVEASVLLDRYERRNRRIDHRLVDPVDSPGEARRLGVDPAVGGVVVTAGDEREVVPTASEADITTALARIVRGVDATLCIAEGHGELDSGSTFANGFSGAAELWVRNGYDLRTVDLLADARVPAGCDAVVLAFPTAPLGQAIEGLTAYLDAGGRLLLLADPDGAGEGLDALLEPQGLGLLPGIVVEGDPANHFPDDPVAPIVTRYSSANPIVARLAPTILPVTQGVAVDDERPSGEGGLAVARLADTSPDSVLQTDDGGSTPGPITVAAAADRSRVEPGPDGDIVRTRIVVVGDADFATNAFVGEGANGQLLARAADWLTVDENLVAVSTNLARPRPLELTSSRRTYALALTAGAVPALFALAGALVWALRRGR